MTERAARWLLAHASRVDVYRVPGLHMGEYPQIIVIARKRGSVLEDVSGGEVLALARSCQNPDALPELEVLDEPIYRLPEPASVRRFHFHPDAITPDLILPALEMNGAHLTNSFQAVVEAPAPPPPLTPIVPPRGGQIGLILAAGLFDGLLLDLEEGQAAVRGVIRMVEINTTPPGMEEVRETFEIRPQVTITLLYQSGKVETITGDNQSALVRFLKDNRDAFLKYIDEHSTPVYDFDYSHLESVFNQVFRNRLLPGRPTTGLFETQKHVSAAGYAALQRRKGILICGEMGIGKSAVGAAIISALHANGQIKPGKVGIILCPPHLVNKWVREVHDAIPGCHVEIVTDVDDTVTFMKLAEANPQRLHVMVLSREKAKLGEGWEAAYVTRKRYIAQWSKNGPIPPQFLDLQTRQPKPNAKRIITQKQLCCPTCGQPIPSKKDLSSLASCAWLERQPRTCYRCQAPLWQLRRRWSGPKQGEKFPRRNPRYPLARFLRERFANRVGVVEFDEIHELKGGGSDQGRAMHDLALVADKTIGLTGTLFGGVSSSLFWIEWAFNPRLYEQYPLEPNRGAAINRWVRANGVLEKVVEYKEDQSASGRYTTVRRVEHALQEAPGISPRLVSELIDHTLWVGLSDLNFALPEYEEIPVSFDLPGDVQAEYDRTQKRMKAYMLERRTEGDASFLSTYLQAVLRYPSSCFRAKPVIHRLKERDDEGHRIQQHVVTMKGFPEERIYPKEQGLIDLLTRELAESRRCVVFVAQTGTLDIQPRLEKLIRQHVPGARPFIMVASSPATDKRDAYLEKQVKAGYNVLIVNPRLVMTGLDLIDFPTLVFYETDYSLYVTSQAARRAWRIGQAHPCRTYYLYHSGTMEAQAIALISKKQAAAALLGGDADGGGLAQLTGGSNSLLAELAKTIAEDEQVVDATQLFKQKAEESVDFTSGWAASITEKAKRQPQESETTVEVSPPEPEPAALPEPAATSGSPNGKPVKVRGKNPAAAIPFHEKYQAIKRQFPRALVLLEMGDFYEALGEDARTLAGTLDIVLTSRKVDDKCIPMAGIPRHSAEAYLTRLIEAGHHVAITTANGSPPAQDILKPSQTLTINVPKSAPKPKAARTKHGESSTGKKKVEQVKKRDPHTDLYGQTFVDPEDREVTVTGPDALFPETHVQVEREGKTYGIPADKVRKYTPARPQAKEDRATQHKAETGVPTVPSDEDYWANRADEREHPLAIQPETAAHVPQPALL